MPASTSSVAPLIVHAVIVVALLAAYVTLTLAGHDANVVLGLVGGYLGGAGLQAIASPPVDAGH